MLLEKSLIVKSSMQLEYSIGHIAKTKKVAKVFASCLHQPLCCYLEGDLGAGKTTFIKEVLQSLGIKDQVSSPTFALIEYYSYSSYSINHIDLYRINNPEELEFTEIPEIDARKTFLFVEWATRGRDYLPRADLLLDFSYQDGSRTLSIRDATEAGGNFLKEFSSCI